MSPEEAARREQDMEVVRREMQRKSRDIIRIYNPLDIDFKFYYDGYPNIVKGKAYKDVSRYIARHYFKHISAFIIGQLAKAKGNGLLEERKRAGLPDYLDRYTQEKEVWEKMPRVDDPDLLKQVADQVIIGLVEEYGLEIAESLPSSYTPPDLRPLHDQIVDMFDKRLAPDIDNMEQKGVKASLEMGGE